MKKPVIIPEPTPQQREGFIKEAIGEDYAHVYAQTAPALWYILFNIMSQKPGDLIHANGVFNAALSAFAMYITTCVSGSEDEIDVKVDNALARIKSIVESARASDINYKEQVSLSASTDGFRTILQMGQGSLTTAFKELNDDIKQLTAAVESRNT